MFKPLHELFENEERVWQEDDVKYFVQAYIQQRAGLRDVHCQSVRDGRLTVRVISPAQHQAVYVLEYDLRRELARAAQFEMTDLRVVS